MKKLIIRYLVKKFLFEIISNRDVQREFFSRLYITAQTKNKVFKHGSLEDLFGVSLWLGGPGRVIEIFRSGNEFNDIDPSAPCAVCLSFREDKRP